MTVTPILGMTDLSSSQSVPEATVNEHDRILEWFAAGAAIEDRDEDDPTAITPSDGEAWLIAASATGIWAGKDGQIALYVNTGFLYFTAKEGMRIWVKDENKKSTFDGSSWIDETAGEGPGSHSITVALSDLTSDLTTGTTKAFWDPPYPITVLDVYAGVIDAPTGAALIFDINEAGVSILSTLITIDDGELHSDDAATQPVVSDATVSGRVTFDIDQVGSTNAGKGAIVTIVYEEA